MSVVYANQGNYLLQLPLGSKEELWQGGPGAIRLVQGGRDEAFLSHSLSLFFLVHHWPFLQESQIVSMSGMVSFLKKQTKLLEVQTADACGRDPEHILREDPEHDLRSREPGKGQDFCTLIQGDQYTVHRDWDSWDLSLYYCFFFLLTKQISASACVSELGAAMQRITPLWHVGVSRREGRRGEARIESSQGSLPASSLQREKHTRLLLRVFMRRLSGTVKIEAPTEKKSSPNLSFIK